MPPVVRSVTLRGGLRLPYVEHGDANGAPVLLLHGVTDSWRSFEPVLPHLPPAIRAFALTQRGHGDADRPAAGYRTRDYATDVIAFADALSLDSFVIVGHSMGATNAERVAIDHPERVRGLVLAATFTGYRRNPVVMDFWRTAVAPLVDPIEPAFVQAFQEGTLARPVPAEFVDLVVGESLKVPARVWRATFEGFLDDDVVAELHRIAAPTLIVWGDRDALCPRADQSALRAAIAGARLVVYEGAGHAVHWEEPRRFARDLEAFVRDLAPAV